MKFLGHLDIMRYFQKALRRAEIDIAFTQGYSPHPILSFAAPLGVGVISTGEYLDLEVHSSEDTETMLRRFNAVMVEGIRILDYRRLPDEAKSAMSAVAAADYELSFREGCCPAGWSIEALNGRLQEFLSQDEILVEKETKNGSRIWDIRPHIYEARILENGLFLQLSTGSTDHLKPEPVLQAFCTWIGEVLPPSAIMICRTEIYCRESSEESSRLIPMLEQGRPLMKTEGELA